jgi:hypothetical protein
MGVDLESILSNTYCVQRVGENWRGGGVKKSASGTRVPGRSESRSLRRSAMRERRGAEKKRSCCGEKATPIHHDGGRLIRSSGEKGRSRGTVPTSHALYEEILSGVFADVPGFHSLPQYPCSMRPRRFHLAIHDRVWIFHEHMMWA